MSVPFQFAHSIVARSAARIGSGMLVVCAVATMAGHSSAYAQSTGPNCNLPESGIGPFDYRNDRRALPMVESRHFTPQVEALIRGESSSSIGSDIAYTLDKFPNHHRALLSMVRLSERQKTAVVQGMPGSVECYFARALRFRSDDVVTRLIFATFLGKDSNRKQEAEHQLELVTKAAPDNAFTQNNVGLIFFDLQNYDRALSQAHTAMRLGLNPEDLRSRLQQVGKWRDPAPGSASTTPAAADKPASAP